MTWVEIGFASEDEIIARALAIVKMTGVGFSEAMRKARAEFASRFSEGGGSRGTVKNRHVQMAEQSLAKGEELVLLPGDRIPTSARSIILAERVKGVQREAALNGSTVTYSEARQIVREEDELAHPHPQFSEDSVETWRTVKAVELAARRRGQKMTYAEASKIARETGLV